MGPDYEIQIIEPNSLVVFNKSGLRRSIAVVLMKIFDKKLEKN